MDKHVVNIILIIEKSANKLDHNAICPLIHNEHISIYHSFATILPFITAAA
jgi:hypothetical protein